MIPQRDFNALAAQLSERRLDALEDLLALQSDAIEREHQAGARVALVTIDGVFPRPLDLTMSMVRKHLPGGDAIARRVAELARDGELVLVLIGVVETRFEVSVVRLELPNRIVASLLAPFPARGGVA